MTTDVQKAIPGVRPIGRAGIYLATAGALDLDARPLTIDGRPVNALAPHPSDHHLVYLTTGHPETLAFLPDPYIDLRPE